MTKAVPFTELSLARAIKGVAKAGMFAVGINMADGTLLISDKPLDATSLRPVPVQNDPASSKWEDKGA